MNYYSGDKAGEPPPRAPPYLQMQRVPRSGIARDAQYNVPLSGIARDAQYNAERLGVCNAGPDKPVGAIAGPVRLGCEQPR